MSAGEIIKASGAALRNLRGVPASFRLTGMMLLRTEKGSIRFDLPDGRAVVFEGSEPGPHAVVKVHDLSFAK